MVFVAKSLCMLGQKLGKPPCINARILMHQTLGVQSGASFPLWQEAILGSLEVSWN